MAVWFSPIKYGLLSKAAKYSFVVGEVAVLLVADAGVYIGQRSAFGDLPYLAYAPSRRILRFLSPTGALSVAHGFQPHLWPRCSGAM